MTNIYSEDNSTKNNQTSLGMQSREASNSADPRLFRHEEQDDHYEDYAINHTLFDHYNLEANSDSLIGLSDVHQNNVTYDSDNYESELIRHPYNQNYTSNQAFTSNFPHAGHKNNAPSYEFIEYNAENMHNPHRGGKHPAPNVPYGQTAQSRDVEPPPVLTGEKVNELRSNDTSGNEGLDSYFDFSNSDFQAFDTNRFNGDNKYLPGNKVVLPPRREKKNENTKVPKRSKKPEFHIPLGNLSTKPWMASRFTNVVSSSHSDSSAGNYFDVSQGGIEPEFEFLDHKRGKSVITPMMNPAISENDEYFNATPGLAQVNHEDSTNNTSDYDHSNDKLFDSYFTSNFGMAENFQNDKFYSSFNFDENPKREMNSPHELTPHFNFEPIKPNARFEPLENEKVNSDHESHNGPYNLVRPRVEREDSNQSIQSLGSIGSAKEKQKKKKTPKGAICSICDKYISRDLTRHLRIHNEVGRFQCVYPKFMCNHKTQYFNRPYDYKKHLLHMHFKFDDPRGKTANTLTDKLPLMGTCQACNARYVANDWLDNHVLTTDPLKKCSYIETND